jgi:hypothetical protein
MTNKMSLRVFMITIPVMCIAQAVASGAKVIKPWSVSLGASLNTSLHKNSDLDKQLNSDFSIGANYKFKNGIKLGTSLSGTKDLLNEREWTWNNSYLSIAKSLVNLSGLKISGIALVHIPLSDYSKNYQKLRTGIMIAPSFSYNLSSIGLERMSLSYRPALTRYFHKYTTSLTGGSNTQYSLSNRLGMSLTITDAAYFALNGSYAKSYTYLGNEKDSYSFSSALGYSPTPKSSVEIGHVNGGSPLATNGKDIEIEVFNNRDSSVYMSFGYQY